MASLAEILTKEQVINSLEYLISHPELKLRNSPMYDLIYKGQIFSPVEVVRWAAKLAQIPNWEKYRLTGGTGTRDPLIAMGIPSLSIVIKKTVQTSDPVQTPTMTETQIPSNTITQMPLNTILYGPPGTGKTYHAIDRALKIVDPNFYDENQRDRNKLTNRFRELLINDWKNPRGLITFTTFHQSMSYEDFIEGIKPLPPDGNAPVQYDIVDGVFKKLCNEASRLEQFTLTIDGATSALTPERFEELYFAFSTTLPLYSEPNSDIELQTKEGYPFELFRSSVNSIVVKAGAKRTNNFISFNELKSVLFDDKEPTYKSYEQIIIDKILEEKSFRKSSADNLTKNYVLIIDEINRGNISQIFGELITLVEDSKRKGQTEELSATLPYSKKTFTVPANVYLIGTMNTADRSVEALDTALRRRFSFEEMSPKPELLSSVNMLCNFWNLDEHVELTYKQWKQGPVLSRTDRFYDLIGLTREKEDKILDEEYYDNRRHWLPSDLSLTTTDFTGINLQDLLSTINRRLEKLLSKDHQIGHAFFISVFSIEELSKAFQQKLIPQLQEYFYGDYGKIGLVLGKGFIEQINFDESDEVFADFDYEDSGLADKPIYRLRDVSKMTNDGFREALGSLQTKQKIST
jgi:5-methylcytosine-specific restriction endonuclease McrBC GTP-binding regulatory subunit McrB